MNELKISPSKVSKFGVKIAKDGILRTASNILAQKGVTMDKIREIWPELSFISKEIDEQLETCLLYTSPSPRDQRGSRMPSSA